MAGILELSDWELKTTMVHMLRALMDKVGSLQEQIDNVSREVEILRKNQENLLEIKNTNRNEENLDRHRSLNTGKKRSELENAQ